MAKLPVRGALTLALTLLLGVGACSETPAGARSPRAEAEVKLLPIDGPAMSRYAATGSRAESEAVTTSTIGPEGGTLRLAGGHSVEFPAGALSAPTTIRGRSSHVFVEVDLGPEGIVFPEGHEPTLRLSLAGVRLVPSQVGIVYLDRTGQVLEELPSVYDAEGHTVSTRLRHFSRYAATGS